MIRISKTQAREITLTIKDDIASYIENNRAAYIKWLEAQPFDDECAAELQRLCPKGDNIAEINNLIYKSAESIKIAANF